MRDYFEKEICANCCIDKQFCDRCGVRKKTANPEKKKPALMARLQESDKNCDGNCKNCVAICGTTQNTIFLEAADAIEELLTAVPKWISVEERLPETGERVLVSNGGFVCESFLSQSGKWQRGGVDMFFMTPTHWCEMPESPKEENKR